MALLKFNSVEQVTPSGYEVETNPVVDGDRNANALFVGDLVATKDKLIIKWDGLTAAQVSTIRGYLVNFFVTVTFQDPLTNSERTGSFYTSPIKHKAFKYDTTLGKITHYEQVSLSLVEV